MLSASEGVFIDGEVLLTVFIVRVRVQTHVISIRPQNYQPAVSELAEALDDFANAITGDSCGMSPLTAVLKQVTPKLANAIVKIQSSHSAQIMVGSLDVYDTLYHAVEDLEKGDVAGFGMQMGTLLQMLKASNCKTKVGG